MKIYVMSLPFDERDTGDYDYCTALTRGLKDVSSNSNFSSSSKINSADYITGSDIDGYDAKRVQELIDLVDKNRGGKTFDISLEKFYSDADRVKNAAIVIKHLSQFADKSAVLNLQMRAPETGFLFTPEELQKIKSMGFKLSVTCHEYELNSNRPWLQSVMHKYFEIADSVIFFNEQDRLSAAKHADHSGFLEKILSGLKEIPSVDVQEELRSAVSIDSTTCMSFFNTPVPSVFITNAEVKSLSCKMLIGEVSCQKGQPIRFKLNGSAFSTKPPFTMEFGVWRDVNFKAAERQPVTLKVSGVLVDPEVGVSDFRFDQADGFVPAYNFTNGSYTFKSVLTRVPPTTAEMFFDVDKCMSAPHNIGIFGLIRQGKGFQKMLDVIEKIHKYHKDSLPLTRLKIVGKPLDLIELAKVINRKFDLVEPSRKDVNNDHIVTEDVLDDILSATPNELQKVIEQFIRNVVVYKKLAIIKNLQRAGMYSDGCEDDIFDRKVRESNPDGEWVKNPSNLQIFVYRLAQMVPEALPVDIYLDMD